MTTLRIATRTLRAAGFNLMQVRTKVTSVNADTENQKTVGKKNADKREPATQKSKAQFAKRAALIKQSLADKSENTSENIKKIKQANKAKEKKAKLASSGPVSARALFVKQQAGKGMNLKQMSEKFDTLGASEKQALVNQAQENLAKRNEIRKSLKKPATKYTLFVKENFAAAHEAAKKQTSDKKVAFKLAAQALAAQYKASKK